MLYKYTLLTKLKHYHYHHKCLILETLLFSMKALISILCLTFVVCEESIVEQVFVQRGDSLTLECSPHTTGRCLLMKNKDLEADAFSGRKFKLVPAEGCKFEAHDLQFTDNGDYICHVNETLTAEFSVLVTVRPNEPELWLSGERIENNTKKAITTDGSVEFICRSYQGYPKSKLVWSVDDVQTEETNEHVEHVNGLLNVDSTLTVNLNQEKKVVCTVMHDSYNSNDPKLLLGVFSKE